MSARVATSAVTLRRVSSLLSRGPNLALQSTNCSLGLRTIEPVAEFIFDRGEEAEKALLNWTEVERALYSRAGVSFVKYRVLENLQVSTKKEVDLSHYDKPIFFVGRSRTFSGDVCFTAPSLEDDGSLSPKYDIYPPVPPFSKYGCGSSCNGLFCFHDSESNIFLWNPATNEFKILPQSQSFVEVSPGVTNIIISSGIWVDHKSQDYKVMRFIVVNFEDDCNHEIELYSLKTDSWKKISCSKFGYCALPNACINGVYYSNARRKGESTQVILSFDCSTETISSVPTPDIDEMQSYHLLDYNGLLSILAYTPFAIETFYEYWVMRNGLCTCCYVTAHSIF